MTIKASGKDITFSNKGLLPEVMSCFSLQEQALLKRVSKGFQNAVHNFQRFHAKTFRLAPERPWQLKNCEQFSRRMNKYMGDLKLVQLLAPFHSVEKIEISDCNLTTLAGLVQLKNLQNVKVLTLIFCSLFTPDHLKSLIKKLPQLKTLSVRCSKISLYDLGRLKRLYPHLKITICRSQARGEDHDRWPFRDGNFKISTTPNLPP